MEHLPMTPAFGALVEGIDLGGLSADALRELLDLWNRQHVVVLRAASPGREAFEHFAGHLGDIDALSDQDAPETEWGAELPGAERPPCACMLRAMDVTPSVTGTWFSSLPAALRWMPADLVARLRWLAIEHGPSLHPMVIVHPQTGEASLFLGRRAGARIAGLPAAESERLLNIVWSYATAASVTLLHRWLPGDVVLWNNLTTLHRHEALPANTVRRLQRVRFKGRYPLAPPIQQEAA